MDYKMVFKQAFSDIREANSCPDDETVVNIVLERAKTMNENKDSMRSFNAQAYEVQTTPAKGHKVFSAAVGIAGTAAVLTGAVFGLNWLNEHGGLREGGTLSSNGAGYSANSESAIGSEEQGRDFSNNSFDEDGYVKVDQRYGVGNDLTVHLKGYKFDGTWAKIYYDLVYKDEIADEFNKKIVPKGSDNGRFESVECAAVGNILSCIANYGLDTPADSVDVTFGYNDDNDSDIFGLTMYKSTDKINEPIYTTAVMGTSEDITTTIIGNAEAITTAQIPVTSADTTVAPEKETSIVVEFTGTEISGMYDFLFYIDGELQKDRNSTDEISQIKKMRWPISGTGTHSYKILVRCPENRLYETLVETTVDFDGELPAAGFQFTFDRQILKELSEHPQGDLSLIAGIYAPGELPDVYNMDENSMETVVTAAADTESTPEDGFTLPDAVSNSNDFYGEYLDTPLTGDEAWELVKERGGIDFDFPLPYDKSLFVFDGCEFYINYADCDVTALVGGTVEFAGWHYGWGNSVLIRDDSGHYWFWGHLAKDLNVAEGDTVEAGAKIGHTGSSGYALCQCYAMRVG